MKLSDYVVDYLAKLGTKHSFFVSGGAVIHLGDSIGKHPKMDHISVQHEQMGGASADAYFRASGKLGVVMTTSGPGATNLLTSICNAFFDSSPLICVTGQVARFRLRPNTRLRQKGFQETDVISIFESVTKYAKLVTDPSRIRYELEKAVYLAQEGRPGPVVLDLPDDLQREEVDPEKLEGFTPPEKDHILDESLIDTLLEMIAQSKRPVLIVGQGVHSAKTQQDAVDFAQHFSLPTLLTWGATDIMTYDNPLNMGGVGVVGPRAGNFAAQASDLVIAIGTRLSQQITGGKQDLFAPNAKKVMVDIDIEELTKFNASTFELDLAIHSDLQDFFKAVKKKTNAQSLDDKFVAWRECIHKWKRDFPLYSPDAPSKPGHLNPHVFIKELSKYAQDGDIIIPDTGANITWTMQAFETKPNQRIFSAWNHTPMGYALPASIGASLGADQSIICLIGDGGLMMCLQELATVSRYNLPVKIFIFDNQGQTTIKQTLEVWLEGRYIGVDKESGLSFPNYETLATAFDLPFYCLDSHDTMRDMLPKMWNQQGPFVCQLKIDASYRITPMLKFGNGLEDLFPKLERETIENVFAMAHAATTEPASVT